MISKIILILLLFSTCIFAAPIFDTLKLAAEIRDGDNLNDVLRSATGNTLKAVKSQAAVVSFIGQTAANAAVEAGKIGRDYVSSVDLEANVNKTEEMVKEQKVAMIERVFAMKREALRALTNLKSKYMATLNSFLGATMTGINNIAQAAQGPILATKTVAFDAYNGLTWNNTHQTIVNINTNVAGALNNTQETISNAISDAQDNINGAINATSSLIINTGNNVLNSIVSGKQQLQDAAERFNSQELFHAGESNINAALDISIKTMDKAGDDLGVFKALDNVVKEAAKLPHNINSFVTKSFDNEEEQVENKEEEGVQ